MKQFQWGVAAYVIAKAAVIMLPALVWVEPGDAAIKTIYILQNCVRWLFLAALCWIFRCEAAFILVAKTHCWGLQTIWLFLYLVAAFVVHLFTTRWLRRIAARQWMNELQKHDIC